jgi:hypothetical protein
MDGGEQILDSSSWLNIGRAAVIRPINVAQLVHVSSLSRLASKFSTSFSGDVETMQLSRDT